MHPDLELYLEEAREALAVATEPAAIEAAMLALTEVRMLAVLDEAGVPIAAGTSTPGRLRRAVDRWRHAMAMALVWLAFRLDPVPVPA